MDLIAINNEINFKVGYYNTNQLALKVYMNTFYGETGNQLSPFFLIAIAGGITSWGQYNTKMIKDFVISEGFQVLYGDTDSLYICPPERYFEELDLEYESGKISKEQYWTRMIEITMEVLDKFKDAVNNLLMLDNSTPFLKMAYEEVLWPFVLTGKKKYIGIAHEGIVNLYPCMPECSLDEFMASKLVFIRGLEIIKRGSSDFLKQVCMGVFKDAFCITETRSLKQIVENKLREISTIEWDPNMFAKSAKYKLPAPGKPGNTSVLRFIERIAEIEATNPQLGVKVPEIGDRFKYVMSKKYPYKYDIRGNQQKISKSDQYEFLSCMSNKEYQKIYGTIEVDMDYYITGEIVGQFARFIIYHPLYEDPNTPFHDGMTDEEYKKADERAHNFAKKQLSKFYNDRYATKYAKKGKLLKTAFKTINKDMQNVLFKQYGNAVSIFALATNKNTDSRSDGMSLLDQNVQHEIFEMLVVEAQKLANKFTVAMPITLAFKGKTIPKIASVRALKEYCPDLYRMYSTCVNDTRSYYRIKQRFLHVKEEEVLTSLRKQLPKFQKVHDLKISDLEKTVASQLVGIDNLGIEPIKPGESDELVTELNIQTSPTSFGYVMFDPEDYPGVSEVELSELEESWNEDPHAPIIKRFYETFISLASVYKQKNELEKFRDMLNDLKTLKVDSKAMPASVQKRDLRSDFLSWMQTDAGGGYTIQW